MIPLDAGVHDDDDGAGAVVAERDGLIRLDTGHALRQCRATRPVLDDPRHDSAECLELLQTVRPDLNGQDRHRPVEVPHHPVSDTLKASLHESLDRHDALALGEDMRRGRQLCLGQVRPLELDQDTNTPRLRRLLVKRGRHHRLALGDCGNHRQKIEQQHERERDGYPAAHADMSRAGGSWGHGVGLTNEAAARSAAATVSRQGIRDPR